MDDVPEDLATALAALRPLLADPDALVRAVAAGRRRGAAPAHVRAELRPVDLRAGRRLQVVTTDGRTPTTRNLAPGPDADAAVEALLAEPFGNWHVETVDRVVQLRVTKKGEAQVHTARTSRRDVEAVARPGRLAHDRAKERLLDPADPLFAALGADADKRRQVDAFLRLHAPVVGRAAARAREDGRPLRVVDLGCGNAYLTFAAHRWLSTHPDVAPLGVRTVGVDVRPDMVDRNVRLAAGLGLDGLAFVPGTIADARVRFGAPAADTLHVTQPPADRSDVPDEAPDEAPDVVLALHACDTATDEALARAVRWGSPVVLAAPCCHHDVQRQLAAAQAAGSPPPHPYTALTRHGILRERFADVLTDALRAALLRLLGYRVDVVEFVDSRHTPRNALVRAARTGARPDVARRAEYVDLADAWHVRPALGRMLAPEVAVALEEAAR